MILFLPGDWRTEVVRIVEYRQKAEHHQCRHAAFHRERPAGDYPSVLQHCHCCRIFCGWR